MSGPALHGPDPSHELAEAEGLDDVVVGTELEKSHPVELVLAGGHDDERHRVARPEAATHLGAVEVGKAEIEQHEVDVLRGLEGCCARPDPCRREALELEPLQQGFADRVVVFHDQDACVADPARCRAGQRPLRRETSNSLP